MIADGEWERVLERIVGRPAVFGDEGSHMAMAERREQPRAPWQGVKTGFVGLMTSRT